MDEPDAGVELGMPCLALFDHGHSDQDEADASIVEEGANLFDACKWKDSRSRRVKFIGELATERVRVRDVVLQSRHSGDRILEQGFDSRTDHGVRKIQIVRCADLHIGKQTPFLGKLQ